MRLRYFALLFLLTTGVLSAQINVRPTSSFAVNFDLARFKNNDSTQYVEMYIACFPHLVTLEQTAEGFRGFVEIRLHMQNRETGHVVIDNRSLIPIVIADTASPAYRTTLVAQMGYIVPEGPYELKVLALDTIATSRRDSLTLHFNITPVAEVLTSSDIEICSNIRKSTNQKDPFYKNSHEVVPNPTLLFGPANHPVIFHYLELYNLDKEETYTVKTVLADVNGAPLQESARKRKFGVQDAIDVGTTNATKLASGRYRFQVVLLNSASEPVLTREKMFYAYNPTETAATASGAQMMETELSGLTSEELAEEFAVAHYLATQQEIDTFSEIKALEGRKDFLAKFWAEVANGKLGYGPINRQEYLLRVKKANERFRVLSRAGYKTDRGRVLVLYSEPDEIDRRPSNEGGKPHEIWSYYTIENGVTFVFVDRTGFGDYTLVHSTKRGELRDDSWQRLLQ